MQDKNDVLRSNPCAGEVNPGLLLARDRVRTLLYTLLEEIGGFGADQLHDSASLDNELALESIALVELQVALEDRLDLQLDPIRIVELNSLGRIVDYVLEEALGQSSPDSFPWTGTG